MAYEMRRPKPPPSAVTVRRACKRSAAVAMSDPTGMLLDAIPDEPKAGSLTAWLR
jgi:hypothetical protein